MPEMDGWQVAQRFRRQSRDRTAILILSANAIDPNHMLDAERLYDDSLMKPIDLRQLASRVAYWVAQTPGEAAEARVA